MYDLFGELVDPQKAIHINVYSDEIWETENKITGEQWIYSVAIYERLDKPIIGDLTRLRYLTDKDDWEFHKEKMIQIYTGLILVKMQIKNLL